MYVPGVAHDRYEHGKLPALAESKD
jgi:hypothetical protein